MDSIADAIVYAAAYISCREENDDTGEDDDSALEHIMAYLARDTRRRGCVGGRRRTTAQESTRKHCESRPTSPGRRQRVKD